MRNVLVLLSVVFVVSCGKSDVPKISSPADGSNYTLGTAFTFAVALEDNNYQDTKIEIKGTLPPNEVTCTGGQGNQLICTSPGAVNGQGTFAQTCNPACSVAVKASRGDKEYSILVNFNRTSTFR